MQRARTKRRIGLTVPVAAALLVLSTGCAGNSDGSKKFITIVAPTDRKPAPTLEGSDLHGAHLSTADYEGKLVVVNVWGPWCAPCRAEMPALKAVAEQYAKKGVQFVGVLNQSNESEALAFNKKEGVTYPSFADQGGALELKFVDSLPTTGLPTTWIIDSDGRVAARILDPHLTAATLAGVIDEVQNPRRVAAMH